MNSYAPKTARSSVVSEGLVCAERCIHELVAAQVEKTPEAVAIVCDGRQLTYGELDDRANRLAAYLATTGVGAEVPVGICVERSIEMVVGVLGILKAGGYYVPLDPAYPAERLSWMLEDTSASVLLTQRHLLPIFSQPPGQVLFLDDELQAAVGQSSEVRPAKARSEQLANLLYTSGSTGKPKGIAMSHGSLCEVLEWQIERLQCRGGTRTAQFAPLSFDVSFLEIFSMLCCGGTVVILSDKLRQDPARLWQFLIDERIEILFVPFVALQQLAEISAMRTAGPACLREIASSGEQLYITPAVVQLFERLENTASDKLPLVRPRRTRRWNSGYRDVRTNGPNGLRLGVRWGTRTFISLIRI
jgi:non-ribosomal peptide synthetase component F